MEVRVVQTNEYKPKPASYLGGVAIGAMGGYALKYIYPITAQEKDSRFKPFVRDLNKGAREFKHKEIEAIRNAKKKAPGTDVFLKIVDDKSLKNKISAVKKLKGPVKEQVMALLNQVNYKAAEVKANGRELVAAMTKHIRPTSGFILAGAGIGFVGTLIYNLSQRSNAEI